MNKKLSIVLLSALAAFTGVASASATASWFIKRANITPEASLIDGEAEGAYFAYGDGNVDTPYGIKTPRHLYNLAWLTYLGYFNDKPQKYFELADNIDMTGWTLPPIGTEFYPFVGNFNGQGYVVANLTTSNQYSDFGTKHPSKVTETYFNTDNNTTDNHPNVVGFFGVVGNPLSEYDGGTYYKNINEIKNFGLYNTIVKTTPSTDSSTSAANNGTLVGVVAGYLDAPTMDIAVDGSKIMVGNNMSPYIAPLTNKLSEQALVGHTTDKSLVSKIDQRIFGVNVSNVEEFVSSNQGNTAGFGGSLDMKTLYDRVLFAKRSLRNNTNGFTNSTANNFVFHRKVNRSPLGVETEDTAAARRTNNNVLLTHASGTASGTYSQYNRTAAPENEWLYLMGGTNKETTFFEYYANSKVTDGKGHYMTSTNLNNGNVSNTNNAGNARGWVIPSKASSVIYTENNNNKYYLTISGNDVTLLRNDEANATIWTREDNEAGLTRFIANGYYLTYKNNDWTIDLLPTLPESPGPEPFYPGDKEDMEKTLYDISKALKNANYPNEANNYARTSSDSYQIKVESQQTYIDTKTTSGVITTNADMNLATSNEFTPGWFFSYDIYNMGAGTETTKIYTYIDGDKYYLVSYCSFTSRNCIGDATFAYSIRFIKDNSSAGPSDTGGNNDEQRLTNWQVVKTTEGKDVPSYTFSVKHSNNQATSRAYLAYTADGVIIDKGNDFNFVLQDPIGYNLDQYKDWASKMTTYNSEHETWAGKARLYDTQYSTYLTNTANSYVVDTRDTQEEIDPETAEQFEDDTNQNKDSMVYDYSDTNYFPINVATDGQNATNFSDLTPTDNNTGYIISGSMYNRNTTAVNGSSSTEGSDTRIAYHGITDQIGDSYASGHIRNVYTIDRTGHHLVTDNPLAENYNINNSSYIKYGYTYNRLDATLSSDPNGRVYGLHFMNAKISKDKYVTAPEVKIFTERNQDEESKMYYNYQLPVGTIDFNLAEDGYINFFAGAFMTGAGQTVDSFFSLHKVFRDYSVASGQGQGGLTYPITDIREIKAVYSDGELDHSYILEFKGTPTQFTKPYAMKKGVKYKLTLTDEQSYEEDNIYTEELMSYTEYASYSSKHHYRIVFDTDWITNHNSENNTLYSLNQHNLYYFEIPTNSGEYCLGPVYGGTGGYLLYLDIGASASRVNRTKIVEHFVSTERLMQAPKGIALVDMPTSYTPQVKYVSEHDPTTGAMVTDRDIDVDAKNSVCVEINVGFSGDFIINRTSNLVAMTRAVSAGGDGSKVIPVYSGEEITSLTMDNVETSVTCETHTTEVLRLSYYDYSVFDENLDIVVFTDTSFDGGAITRYVEQYLNVGKENEQVFSGPEQYHLMNIFKDNGTSFKYIRETDTYEFLDPELVPITSDISTVLIDFRMVQDKTDSEAGQKNSDYVRLVNPGKTDDQCYYTFEGYEIYIRPDVNEIEVIVIDVATGAAYKAIYFGDSSEVSAITVSDEGTTITIPVYVAP